MSNPAARYAEINKRVGLIQRKNSFGSLVQNTPTTNKILRRVQSDANVYKGNTDDSALVSPKVEDNFETNLDDSQDFSNLAIRAGFIKKLINYNSDGSLKVSPAKHFTRSRSPSPIRTRNNKTAVNNNNNRSTGLSQSEITPIKTCGNNVEPRSAEQKTSTIPSPKLSPSYQQLNATIDRHVNFSDDINANKAHEMNKSVKVIMQNSGGNNASKSKSTTMREQLLSYFRQLLEANPIEFAPVVLQYLSDHCHLTDQRETKFNNHRKLDLWPEDICELAILVGKARDLNISKLKDSYLLLACQLTDFSHELQYASSLEIAHKQYAQALIEKDPKVSLQYISRAILISKAKIIEANKTESAGISSTIYKEHYFLLCKILRKNKEFIGCVFALMQFLDFCLHQDSSNLLEQREKAVYFLSRIIDELAKDHNKKLSQLSLLLQQNAQNTILDGMIAKILGKLQELNVIIFHPHPCTLEGKLVLDVEVLVLQLHALYLKAKYIYLLHSAHRDIDELDATVNLEEKLYHQSRYLAHSSRLFLVIERLIARHNIAEGAFLYESELMNEQRNLLKDVICDVIRPSLLRLLSTVQRIDSHRSDATAISRSDSQRHVLSLSMSQNFITCYREVLVRAMRAHYRNDMTDDLTSFETIDRKAIENEFSRRINDINSQIHARQLELQTLREFGFLKDSREDLVSKLRVQACHEEIKELQSLKEVLIHLLPDQRRKLLRQRAQHLFLLTLHRETENSHRESSDRQSSAAEKIEEIVQTAVRIIDQRDVSTLLRNAQMQSTSSRNPDLKKLIYCLAGKHEASMLRESASLLEMLIAEKIVQVAIELLANNTNNASHTMNSVKENTNETHIEESDDLSFKGLFEHELQSCEEIIADLHQEIQRKYNSNSALNSMNILAELDERCNAIYKHEKESLASRGKDVFDKDTSIFHELASFLTRMTAHCAKNSATIEEKREKSSKLASLLIARRKSSLENIQTKTEAIDVLTVLREINVNCDSQELVRVHLLSYLVFHQMPGLLVLLLLKLHFDHSPVSITQNVDDELEQWISRCIDLSHDHRAEQSFTQAFDDLGLLVAQCRALLLIARKHVSFEELVCAIQQHILLKTAATDSSQESDGWLETLYRDLQLACEAIDALYFAHLQRQALSKSSYNESIAPAGNYVTFMRSQLQNSKLLRSFSGRESANLLSESQNDVLYILSTKQALVDMAVVFGVEKEINFDSLLLTLED